MRSIPTTTERSALPSVRLLPRSAKPRSGPAQDRPATAAAVSGARSGARVSLLFATPVVLGELDAAEELNADLERRILAKRDEDQGLKLSNRGGWQSTHDFVQWSGEAGMTVINRACALASENVARPDRTPPRWTVDAWANVSGPGAFNMPHVHGGTYWAAVYYVRV